MAVLEGVEFYISKRVGKAIMDYQMLSEGDKIAVAVSGGKDSLSLLKILCDRQKFVPIKYELLAIHIDFGYPYSVARVLERYFKKLGINYYIKKSDVLKKTPRAEINCFWCSWNRRKELFILSERFGCNKVALGHHKDDIVETILLNLFFHGEISAMSPRQELFNGKIIIIRPLVYVEEALIKKFASRLDFKFKDCFCPQGNNSQRTKIAWLIKEMEKICPEIKTNIFKSVKRIKEKYLL